METLLRLLKEPIYRKRVIEAITKNYEFCKVDKCWKRVDRPFKFLKLLSKEELTLFLGPKGLSIKGNDNVRKFIEAFNEVTKDFYDLGKYKNALKIEARYFLRFTNIMRAKTRDVNRAKELKENISIFDDLCNSEEYNRLSEFCHLSDNGSLQDFREWEERRRVGWAFE